MKKTGLIITALLVSYFLISCGDETTIEKPTNYEPQPITEADAKLVAAGNEFTWNLFREIVSEDSDDPNKNIFTSPLSASIALGMTYNGARNQTQDEMETTLGFEGMTPFEINETYRKLIDRFSGLDPKVKFQIANSIWHADWFQVDPQFLEVNQTYFDAVVSALDFESPEAVVTINKWVDEKTSHKINKIIDRIPDYAVMYLINALYFKGTWTYQFDKYDTKPGVFQCPDGTEHSCDFMYTENDSLRFLMNSEVLGVELPYSKGDYRLLAVMPNDPDTDVNTVIKNLKTEKWSGWLSSLALMGEDLRLPRFKFAYETLLNKPLIDMGMQTAFTDLADFTGINSGGNLQITEVKQKTFVQLDETGTEAAAVTSVEVGITSIGPSFTFNRPFLVIIYENTSGAILFVGKIAKPEFSD